MQKLAIVVAIAGVCFACGPRTNAQAAPAQESNPHVISNQQLDMLRKDLRSQRKQLIAANLKLTDAEAKVLASLRSVHALESRVPLAKS